MDLERVWAETHDRRVLKRLGAEDPTVPKALLGRGKAAHQHWLGLCSSGADLPLLLKSLTEGNSNQALERLEALVEYHQTPGLLAWIAHWIQVMPYRTPPGANRFWKRVLERYAALIPQNGTSTGSLMPCWPNMGPAMPSNWRAGFERSKGGPRLGGH